MPIACKTRDLEENRIKVPGKRKQCTLQNPISLQGIGLFTGETVTLRLVPAEKDTGILFVRADLPEKVVIPALLNYLVSSSRCTMLKKGEAVIQTIEHLMAALYACGIGNLIVEISGSEVPIFDGSSLLFIDAILKAGICQHEAETTVYSLKTPVYIKGQDIQMVALPSEEYRVSYTLHYPHSPYLRSQFYSTVVNQEQFVAEIASCRTFSLYEEVMPLLEKGFIKGGSLDNGVIVKGNEVLNPGGVRFPDEMARHKVLDLIGDLALMGCFFTAHIIAIRSGHTSNHELGKELFNRIKMENS